MQFSYAEAMTDFRYYIPLAKAAEAAGYASMTIPTASPIRSSRTRSIRTRPTATANSWTARRSSRRSC